MLVSLPVNFLLYTALSTTDYEIIQFDGSQVVPRDDHLVAGDPGGGLQV